MSTYSPLDFVDAQNRVYRAGKCVAELSYDEVQFLARYETERGDAWRAKYDEDTDTIAELRRSHHRPTPLSTEERAKRRWPFRWWDAHHG